MSDTSNLVVFKTSHSIVARRRFLQALKKKSMAAQASQSSTMNKEAADEDAALLMLHQSLQDIHAGMIRTNVALSDLVEEVRLLRN